MALGPEVDSPDRVRVLGLISRPGLIEATLAYTRVREQGATLRRNIPWHPLVELHLSAPPPGAYRVRAVWRKVKSVEGSPTVLGETESPWRDIGIR